MLPSTSVSVVLPVYNGSETIHKALTSILEQTYTKFELIVINDGSTDNTQEILESFTDIRIRILNQPNRGLVSSLNRGILESKGKYIARMDADDIALPQRMEKQVDFLEKNPTVAVVGTAAWVLYSDGSRRLRRRPPDTPSIRNNIVRFCPFFHSSVMIRRDVFDKVGLYDASKDGSKQLLVEDYDLWVRMLEANYDMANLPDVLMLYYRRPCSILRSRSFRGRLKQQILSRIDVIKRLHLGFSAYLTIMPVVFLSVLNHLGLKLDRFFNVLSCAPGTVDHD
jgi:glycosyltransferase involved in cell wall biosynthesis